MLVEEEDLQGYGNTDGTSYRMTTKSGDQMNRMRPECEQRKEARHRKKIIITRLENWIGEGKAPVDETAEYFS